MQIKGLRRNEDAITTKAGIKKIIEKWFLQYSFENNENANLYVVSLL